MEETQSNPGVNPGYQTPPRPFDPVWQPPRPKRRFGCLTGLLCGCLASAVLAAVALCAVPVGLAALFGAALDSVGEVDIHKAATYQLVRGEAGDDARNVLRLELSGVITGKAPNRWVSEPDCDVAFRAAIERAIDDDDIDALLLIVNTPGGGVTASDAIYHALERFKAAKPGRKVIVQAGDLIASGGYYLAMQADWIRILPTTTIGSIGVIYPGVNFSGLAQKLGIADNSVASGASKDLGNPLKPVNPEHNAIIRTLLTATYDRFVGLVAKGRGIPEADVRRLADGRVFTPQDAVNLRLADEIGYEDTLDAKIAEILGCAEGDLAIYEPRRPGNTFRAVIDGLPSAIGRGIGEGLLGADPATPAYLYK